MSTQVVLKTDMYVQSASEYPLKSVFGMLNQLYSKEGGRERQELLLSRQCDNSSQSYC